MGYVWLSRSILAVFHWDDCSLSNGQIPKDVRSERSLWPQAMARWGGWSRTHQRASAEAKQLQKKKGVFLTSWCWENLPCTSKSMCNCPCPISPFGLPGSHIAFLLPHTSTVTVTLWALFLQGFLWCSFLYPHLCYNVTEDWGWRCLNMIQLVPVPHQGSP